MSIETWKEEFYPTPANAEMSDMEALLHAKRKWEGLRKENLLKHELFTSCGDLLKCLASASVFKVGADSCALCMKNVPEWSEQEEKTICNQCPIYLSRGEVSCDNLTKLEESFGRLDENFDTPWHMFTRFNNPEPMLEEINNAIEFLQEKNK